MSTALVIFALTYLAIGIQRLPGLHVDRPSGALMGAVAMVAFGVLTFEEALAAIDLDTILFLLGMMIVLAYLELSGFFQVIERRVMGLARSPRGLLVWIVVSSGLLSALFMNDTICLMLAPVVIRVTRRLELPPLPYLLGLAAGANVGSTCTILGNPQNALIGVRSGLPFLSFLAALGPVSILGLAATAGLLAVLYRREVSGAPMTMPPPRQGATIEPWLLAAGMASGAGMVLALALGVRPAAAAMTAAAAVMLAGARQPRQALREVDWMLLLFFAGLFVVMRGVEHAGLSGELIVGVAGPLDAVGPVVLARIGAAVTLLSQAVSNVPAVLLFVPAIEALPATAAGKAWLGLAAFSTLAGNLTIIGSVANVIVFESARREGIEVGFGAYLKAGLPVTVITLAIAWAWLSFV